MKSFKVIGSSFVTSEIFKCVDVVLIGALSSVLQIITTEKNSSMVMLKEPTESSD